MLFGQYCLRAGGHSVFRHYKLGSASFFCLHKNFKTNCGMEICCQSGIINSGNHTSITKNILKHIIKLIITATSVLIPKYRRLLLALNAVMNVKKSTKNNVLICYQISAPISEKVTQVYVTNNASLSILINQTQCKKFISVTHGNSR